jgi:hypothetical protein
MGTKSGYNMQPYIYIYIYTTVTVLLDMRSTTVDSVHAHLKDGRGMWSGLDVEPF